MPTQLNADVWYIIIDILRATFLSKDLVNSRDARRSLLALRLVNRSLAVAVAPILLSNIGIRKLDAASYEHLEILLRSQSTCQVVKTYELQPKITTSRQGDQKSPYHKIPPTLDYGRNSSSPGIRESNRKLREAAIEWEEQYRIIYPAQTKASAFLKKTFQWAGSGGRSSLKDSIYLTALDAFTNLTKLVVRYPPSGPSTIRLDVSKAYSTALGRYLATNPAHLTEFRVRSLTPQDFVSLVRALSQGPQEATKLSLCTTTLELSLEPAMIVVPAVLHTCPDFGTSLATLLQHMNQLQNFRMFYHADAWDAYQPKLETLLVSPFTPPALPELKQLTIGSIAFTAQELIALTATTPSRLTGLVLDTISLTTPSWAQVFTSFAESETLEYVLQPGLVTGMCYHELPDGTPKRWYTEADHKAHLAWEVKVDERLRRSGGGGLPMSARLPKEQKR